MKRYLLTLIAGLFCFSTQASHILGGELFYEHISGTDYQVTLILYRDCSGVGLNATASIYGCAADGSGNDVSGTLNRVSQGNLPTDYFLNPCLVPPAGGACIEENIYQGILSFPDGRGGYLLTYNTCCRSPNVDNLDSPGSKWANYYVFLPDASDPSVGVGNNSARFATSPPPNICLNDSIYYDHSAHDPDGDIVTYTFWNPKGNTSSETCPPLTNTPFIPPYTANYPIPSANPAFSIDPNTGAMIGKANQAGQYVYSVRYIETRGGVPISYGVRDFVFTVTACSPVNPVADFDPQAAFNVSQGYCGDLGVQLTNTSVNSIAFIWDFGDTAVTTDTSTAEDPYYKYDRPGTYEIMLISAPGRPCADTLVLQYEVYQDVEALFTAPDTQCLDNNLFTFEPDTFNVEDSVIWDFGPNASPQISNEFITDSIQFLSSGTHSVRLIMMNETCADTVVKDIYVAPSLTAFYAPQDPGCILNHSYNLTANGSFSPAASIEWNFGPRATPGTANTGTVNNVQFDTLGYHVVTLTVSETGCTVVYVDSILITDTVTADFNPPAAQCLNSNAYDFVNEGTYDTTATFLWEFGNALPDSSTAENPTGVHFNSSGKHEVTLTVYQNGCTAVFKDSVEVTDAPIGSITPIPNTCIDNATFDFIAGGSFNPSAVISWDFGFTANPPISSDQDVYGVNYPTTGTKTVTLTISDNGCTDVQTISFDVTGQPSAGFPPVADQCLSNGPFDFINTGNYGPDATFLWDFDSNVPQVTDTTEDVYGVQWTQAGTYTVCLTVSENGCDAQYCQTFTLTPAPLASFDPLSTECITVNNYDLNNTGVYGAAAVHNWVFENGIPATSSDENPLGVSFTQEGWNDITLNITENGCTDTYVDSVFISSVPAPNYTPGAKQCLLTNSFDFVAAGSYTDSATFMWDFGPNATPATSTDSIVYGVVFSTSGNQPVSLTVSEYGCSGSYFDIVEVTDPPSPSFTPGAIQCLNSNSFDFTAEGTYDPAASFLWEFGVGSIPQNDTNENVTGVTFNSAGWHPVTFTVTQDGCSVSYTDSVEVAQAPVASTTPPAAQCITANSFDFVGGGTYGGTASFSWDFGPNASSQTASTKDVNGIVFSTTGWQDIQYVISEFGCVDTFNFQVKVTEQPTAFFPSQGPQCVSSSSFNFAFQGTGDTTTTFAWDFGNATPPTSTNQNVNNVIFYSTGWQVCTLTVTGIGCSDTYIDSVETTPNPVSQIDSLPEQCVGNNSFDWTHQSTYGANATFLWSFNNATPATSTDEFPTGIVFNTAGTHQVSLTVEENGCSHTTSTTVLITPEPVASFAQESPQCIDGNLFNFSFDGSSRSNTTYSWNFGPNGVPATSSNMNPSNVSFNSVGTQSITLSVTDNGCTDTYIGTVEIYPLPVPSFTASNLTGCVPFTADFTNTSTSNGALTYVWDFGDNSISTAENPSHTYTVPGVYSVTLAITSATGCVGVFDTTLVNIIDAQTNPTPGFLLDTNVLHIYDPEVWIFPTALNVDSIVYIFSNPFEQITNSDPFQYSFQDTGLFEITQFCYTSAGCIDTVTKTVRVNPEFMFFSPNAFSPDRDGVNEEFIQKGVGIKEYHIDIYNRWGELVFSSDDINDSWNGITPDGQRAVADAYAYRTRITTYFGEELEYKGQVLLLK